MTDQAETQTQGANDGFEESTNQENRCDIRTEESNPELELGTFAEFEFGVKQDPESDPATEFESDFECESESSSELECEAEIEFDLDCELASEREVGYNHNHNRHHDHEYNSEWDRAGIGKLTLRNYCRQKKDYKQEDS